MDYWNMPLNSLGELTLKRLSSYLDNCTMKGWRKLAEIVGTDSRFKCSEKELETCSLKVLDPDGSPSRYFIQLIAERGCPVNYVLSCLDKMGHTEALQCVISMALDTIQIIVQPKSQDVTVGDRVSLCCQAIGPPGLSYQWFRGKNEVRGGNSSELLFNCVDRGDGDWYVCRVHCGNQYSFSEWVRLRVYSSPTTVSKFCKVNILVHPISLSLKEGDTMVLSCSAVGNPPPQYQWFRNDQLLPEANKPDLEVNGVTTADRGKYCCHVFNLYHEVRSKVAAVEIGPNTSFNNSFIVDTDAVSSPGLQLKVVHHPTRFYATDKVALLIGNMNYLHHKQLKAPMVDVHELTNLLRQLDFKVVSLLDLTRLEMHRAVNEFLLLLDKGVYGLLYYAGHGYENYGNSFMVPIDAPYSYTSEHCLCVQNILQLMQEKQTGLNIFLLDMCRKRNMHDEIIPQMEALRVTANIVYGYATCPDAEAYEISQGELTNGIFISFLKKRLLEDEKITVLLDKVAEDMGKCELTKGRQALEIRSSLSERRSLRDKINPPDYYDEFSARNLQWAKANVLPESKYVQFECGALIRLGFAAEFSNIMIIYASIVQTPQHIIKCEARLTDFSEDLDVNLKHTNKGCPEETGSVIFSFSNFNFPEQCLYTRLSGLQKLRKELSFSICLQYQYKQMEETIEEKKVVNIGKPLVSKLNLHGSEHESSYISVYGLLQSSSSEPTQMLMSNLNQTYSLPVTSKSLNCFEGYTDSHRSKNKCTYQYHSTQEQLNQDQISPGASSALRASEPDEKITAQIKSLGFSQWPRDLGQPLGMRRDNQPNDGELHTNAQSKYFYGY
ncbi:mucosa-associated lymphoid tissue lymphoma translocation protein 1-like [Pristis pectinata]|uniref:mucosa-associated lymphoid tissue lymphoma translocation protein 1-like n=1 Tax=Pristis pectinata TaxID=685728 RepID=UPI00223E7249|nr:mucosa-associated lymphoid tissue lymphoma translocation protein 1-like [Pristis pectinata]